MNLAIPICIGVGICIRSGIQNMRWCRGDAVCCSANGGGLCLELCDVLHMQRSIDTHSMYDVGRLCQLPTIRRSVRVSLNCRSSYLIISIRQFEQSQLTNMNYFFLSSTSLFQSSRQSVPTYMCPLITLHRIITFIYLVAFSDRFYSC